MEQLDKYIAQLNTFYKNHHILLLTIFALLSMLNVVLIVLIFVGFWAFIVSLLFYGISAFFGYMAYSLYPYSAQVETASKDSDTYYSRIISNMSLVFAEYDDGRLPEVLSAMVLIKMGVEPSLAPDLMDFMAHMGIIDNYGQVLRIPAPCEPINKMEET